MGALAVVAGLAAVALLIWRARQAAARRRELAAFAGARGLRYSAGDPFRTLDDPFALFRQGDGRGVENVVWGELEGATVRLFDYWFYETQHNSNGPSTRHTVHYSCAVVLIDAAAPHLRIAREGLLSSLTDLIGLRDIELESEEFNRRFEIRCRDRKFAYALLDARMMAWLLEAPKGLEFEVLGDKALLACRRLPVAELDLLGSIAAGFRRMVPPVLASLYPPNLPRSSDSG